MSAERLREAAALMRARAESIPAGPWEKEFSDVIRTDVPFGSDGYLVAETATVERANYIASWHPLVAFAVADVLDLAAQWAEDHPGSWPPASKAALVVANAYMGQP